MVNLPVPSDEQTASLWIQQEPAFPTREDAAIYGWLKEKNAISHSAKTIAAYSQTIEAFRAQLQNHYHIDLFDENIQAIYKAALSYFEYSKVERKVTAKTKQQRRAILSSFYRYCNKLSLYPYNPIELTINPKGEPEHAAPAYAREDIEICINAINTDTIGGLRNYILLRLALVTGRRSSELARLTWGDIRLEVRQMIVHWLCKGNKPKKDALTEDMIETLAIYREELKKDLKKRHLSLKETTPVFPSFSNRTYGKSLTIQAIGRIALDILGDSRFHALRHTLAITMEDEKIPIDDIREQLGHTDVKITGEYLKRKRKLQTSHAKTVEQAFKFKSIERKEQ